jgi:hypothetical protein
VIIAVVTCLVFWLAIAATLIKSDFDAAKDDPEQMPGGGRPAIVIKSLAWPLMVLVLLVLLPIWLVDYMIDTWRGL